jgi:hypothetical protein
MSNPLMDNLHDIVAKAQDLPAEGEPEAPKPKRQRYAMHKATVTLLSTRQKQVYLVTYMELDTLLSSLHHCCLTYAG